MTIEYIRYKIAPEDKARFIQTYTRAATLLDSSPFCSAYELTECEEEPGQFMLRIEWTSTEDHMKGFRKSQDFPAFFNHVRPYFNDIQEMRHYRRTPLVKIKSEVIPVE
jgi:quinol monooxygenase YgiN